MAAHSITMGHAGNGEYQAFCDGPECSWSGPAHQSETVAGMFGAEHLRAADVEIQARVEASS